MLNLKIEKAVWRASQNWASMAYKNNLVNKKNWTGDDELASSIAVCICLILKDILPIKRNPKSGKKNIRTQPAKNLLNKKRPNDWPNVEPL